MIKLKLILAASLMASLAACNTTATTKMDETIAMKKPMAELTTGQIIKRLTEVQFGNKGVNGTIHANGTTTGVVTATGVNYVSEWRLVNNQYCRKFVKGIIDPDEKCATFKAVLNADGKITAVIFVEAGKDDRTFPTVKPA